MEDGNINNDCQSVNALPHLILAKKKFDKSFRSL